MINKKEVKNVQKTNEANRNEEKGGGCKPRYIKIIILNINGL